MNAAQRWIREELNSTTSVDDAESLAVWRAAQRARHDDRGRDDGQDRARLRWAILIAIGFHVALYLGLRQWTRLHLEVPEEVDVIHLRLIEPVPPPDPAPMPLPDEPVPQSSPNVRQEGVRQSATAQDSIQSATQARPSGEPVPRGAAEVSAARPVPELFDREGRVLLPADTAAPDPSAFARQPAPGNYRPDPMAHVSPLPYTPTPFDKYWKPDGETLLDEWVRKATRKAVYDTQSGTRITCEAFLFFSACGWGPIPRIPIEELKAMRENPPLPRRSADDPYVQPGD